MTTKRTLRASALIISVAALAIWGGALLQGADTEISGIDIAKQQMALAEQALKDMTVLESTGQASPSLRDVPRWSRRFLEATRRSGASKADIVDAARQHVARMDSRVERLKRMLEAETVVTNELFDAEYEALEAKRLLVEAQDAK
jgi:hypothetical protein